MMNERIWVVPFPSRFGDNLAVLVPQQETGTEYVVATLLDAANERIAQLERDCDVLRIKVATRDAQNNTSLD